ncbi:MAG: ArsR/SmtB family transcription factor [Acidimicrobiales bacterium]
MKDLLDQMRAAAEPTRLRILVVLDRVELTVSELCRVLEQSQPRVSRHLKLLCDAGLLVRTREGTSAFYRPVSDGPARQYVDGVLSLVDEQDPALVRDRERLMFVRAERSEAASAYFSTIASSWDEVRDLHVSDLEVEVAMLESVDGTSVANLLDVGTGTGRVLEVFADQISNGLGIDLNREMLGVARSRLDELGHSHCKVRQGNVYDLEVTTGTMDVAVLHHVLHFLDDPAQAIHQTARTLRAGGRLVVVDFAPHSLELLRTDYAHHRLGFADNEVASWCEAAGLVDVTVAHLHHEAAGERQGLTVSLWNATQRSDAPDVRSFEAVS